MKDKIITMTFLIYIFLFGTLHIIIPDKTISETERRYLKTMPAFELKGEYITEVDAYLLDHFPLRDKFRSIKANYNYNVLNKLDNNGIYLKDSKIYKSDYPTNEKSISNFIKNINTIKGMLTNENNIYLMIIPDKNYYLNEKNFLHIDYEYIYNEMNKLNLNKIDLRNILNENDYYETDTHWKQENLDKVIKRMSEVMNFNYERLYYNQNQYNKFYGVYYGESAVERNAEAITYLTNNITKNAKVSYLENHNLSLVYDEDKLNGLDAYEVYLSGASAYIEILNEQSKSDKELVIFRDSFGSSLAPLLINYYHKITIIDNRYISSKVFNNLVTFNNQDILFMYSTLIVNNSFSLKN